MTRRRRAMALLMALGAVVLVPAVPVLSQTEGISLTTPYSGVAVEAGDKATFDLSVTAPQPQQVALEVVGVPEGWQAEILGGGFVVRNVTAGETSPSLRLDVTVPPDAPEGVSSFRVVASSASGRVELPLEVEVSSTAGGSISLDPEFPVLSGSTSSDFAFDLTLQNDTPADLELRLSAEAPAGWQAQARPSVETQASTIEVEGGGSGRVTVEVTPPLTADAGTYPILVRAEGDGVSVETELAVELVGRFEVGLSTPDGRLNADVTAGSPSDVVLLVTNSGTAPLEQLRVSSAPPAGWEVLTEPEVIPQLPAGESLEVVATVTPSSDAVAGDYIVTFQASNEEVSESVDVRATVSPSPVWGFVGIALIGVTIAGLGMVFRRFGRR